MNNERAENLILQPREIATDEELATFYAWYWETFNDVYGR